MLINILMKIYKVGREELPMLRVSALPKNTTVLSVIKDKVQY